MSTPKDKAFLPALESARGIAALLVMIAHFWWWTADSAVGARLLRCATLGVDFFFVLSGFILSRNYLSPDAATTDCRKYLWHRLVRIYPLHLFFVIAFALAYQAQGKSLGQFSWMAELTLTTAIHTDVILNGLSWSLSAEWVSYLAFAVLLTLTTDSARRRLAMSLVVLAGIAVLFLTHGDITQLRNKWGFVRAFFGFFIGCLAWRHQAHLTDRRSLLWIALALQIAYVSVGYGQEQLKIWIVITFAPLVVYLSLPAQQSGWLVWRPVLWVGTISFSLYMGHVFWGEVLEAVLPRLGLPLQEGHHALEICKSCAAFAGAALTYYLVEKPARSWGRSLSPFRAR